jgi:hypothetical protein
MTELCGINKGPTPQSRKEWIKTLSAKLDIDQSSNLSSRVYDSLEW